MKQKSYIDKRFYSTPSKYIPGINFPQNPSKHSTPPLPNISRVSISRKIRQKILLHPFQIYPGYQFPAKSVKIFYSTPSKYIPGINFPQNPSKGSTPPLPNISRVSIFRKILRLYDFTGVEGSGPCDVIKNDEEHEPNNVSIGSIVPGEAWTLSNRC